MFDNLIITGMDKIIRFLKELDIDIFLIDPENKHVIAFICAMVLKGYNGKVSDVSELTSYRHRTCKGYILCDSWCRCKKLFDASKEQGYTYVGALRTNRVIYTKGHGSLGIKIHAFAKTFTAKDVSLVKAGGHEYYVYAYRGKLNGL